MPQLLDAAKRGSMLAGGLPLGFPTISIRGSVASPTSMYLRNLMSIGTEEMLRAQPMDSANWSGMSYGRVDINPNNPCAPRTHPL